ncbi:MAG TPA: fibrinogen-like YCDxxxxGGGW domain-containing protein [Enhygromyxa sp.]|nr:fibrinogen-like YCDxxxxGGGW domain-containing protein [Enhygromyxa sp.]
MLIALALPLACFKGDDNPATEGTSTDSTDTGDPCEVATEGCSCTGGGGCNPGLTCVDGLCEPVQAVCGNGQTEPGESCDDGNANNTDTCTTLCAPPSCDDGIVSGDEIDVDCGIEGCGVGCDFGQACASEADCGFPLCGPAPGGGEGMVCEFPTSCANWLASNPGATDNIYMIDPDGAAGPIPPMEVFCHMSKNGGGWTLLFVASDDDVDTWTWNNRSKMSSATAAVGMLNARHLDFMSPAYFRMPFSELMFIHQPSNIWAHYAPVHDGSSSFADFLSDITEPVCDFNLAGQGVPLVEGSTLSMTGSLCDTQLYFNLGDHDGTLEQCGEVGSPSNSATFGPVWNAVNNSTCPFDDPAFFGLGPHGPCGACTSEASTEWDYLGFANALGLNIGQKKVGENYMQMYAR